MSEPVDIVANALAVVRVMDFDKPISTVATCAKILADEVERLQAKVQRLKDFISDLQTGDSK